MHVDLHNALAFIGALTVGRFLGSLPGRFFPALNPWLERKGEQFACWAFPKRGIK